MDSNKQNPKDYADVYGEAEIERDLARVNKVEKQYEQPISRRALIAEAILVQQIELADWLGEHCRTIETAKYDDYFNHTDFVAEWTDKNGEPLRLAVDITCTEENADFSKKAGFITKELGQGRGTDIKYFQSDKFAKKGTIKNLPRVIIPINKEVIIHLCDILAPAMEKKSRGGRQTAYSKLAHCALQTHIIEEMIKQLDRQTILLEQNNGTDTVIYKNIQKIIAYLEKLFDKKIDLVEDRPSDQVLKIQELSDFFRPS